MPTISVWKNQILLKDLTEPPKTLGDHAKYSERLGAWHLALSKQNLQRVYAEYGRLNVREGQGRIESLKLELRRFNEMLETAMLAKTSPNLPMYEYKVKPIGPYQHRGVVYLVNVPRAALFADCGCLTGDTEIRHTRAKCSRTLTIAELYYNQANPRSNRRAHVKTHVRSLKEDVIGLHPMQRVVESGVKEVWKLKLKDGKELKATPDHEIMTTRGWVPLQDLSTKDAVMVDNLVKHHSRGYLGYEHFGHGVPEFSKVVSTKFVGKEMTYDIVCEDPHRNFVANGIVVHNCGKTYMVACAVEQLIQKGLVARGKILVCGKLATLHQGWAEDIKRFTGLKANILWVPTAYKRKEKIRALLEDEADIYLINHEGVRIYQKELAAKGFQSVVIDESTVMKSYRSDRSKGGAFAKAVAYVSHSAQRRIIMTGTPAPNGAHDLWGQLNFLDPHGFMIEASWKDFRTEHMNTVYYGDPLNPATPVSYVMKQESIEKIANIVNPLAYRVRIDDVLPDLPELTIIKRIVTMNSAQAEHYTEMEETLHTKIDDEHVTVTIVLSQIQKLRQITGGFIMDAKGEAHPIAGENPKLEMLDQLLNEEIAHDKKVIIFAQYKEEFELLKERYKEHNLVTYYGDVSAKDKLANLDAFINDPKVRIIILHPKSCAHGVTLTCSHYIIFYSGSHSSEEDYQALHRIKRNSQKHPMFVYYLLAFDTIDEVMFDVVSLKHHQQAALIDRDHAPADAAAVWGKLKEQVKRHKKKKKGRTHGKTE